MSDKAKQHPTKTGEQRVFLLRNPKAGSGARAAMIGRLCQLLDECGLQTETFTDLDLFASETAKAWANGELRSVMGKREFKLCYKLSGIFYRILWSVCCLD